MEKHTQACSIFQYYFNIFSIEFPYDFNIVSRIRVFTQKCRYTVKGPGLGPTGPGSPMGPEDPEFVLDCFLDTHLFVLFMTFKDLGGTLAGLRGSRGPKEGLLGAFGSHFGDHGSARFDFWPKKGAHGPPKAPKMVPKWLQNRFKNHFKIHVIFCQGF